MELEIFIKYLSDLGWLSKNYKLTQHDGCKLTTRDKLRYNLLILYVCELIDELKIDEIYRKILKEFVTETFPLYKTEGF